MAKKFIPDADTAFAEMAHHFSEKIASNPAHYDVSEQEAREIVEKVMAFKAAMTANYNPMTRCRATVMRKDETRAEAERIIRDVGNRIRSNRKIDPGHKTIVRVTERPTRLRRRECPQTPPRLQFLGPTPSSNTIEGKHVIGFLDCVGCGTAAKPEGAARLELFVDLVPPGEPIPKWPGQRWGGRMWYLRSFTRSPIEVDYPKADEPMRVVYWGRWASATGETGPFSATLATRVEGFDRARPMLGGSSGAGGKRQMVIITSCLPQLPGCTIESATTPGDEVAEESCEGNVKLLGNETADAA